MGATKDQDLTVHTRKNYKKKENHHHSKNNDKRQNKVKRYASNVRCHTCDEKGHLQEIVPSGKRGTMLMLPKTINQQTKDS